MVDHEIDTVFGVVGGASLWLCKALGDNPQIKPILPDNIKILYAEDLQKEYPSLTPKQREYEAAKKYGAVLD